MSLPISAVHSRCALSCTANRSCSGASTPSPLLRLSRRPFGTAAKSPGPQTGPNRCSVQRRAAALAQSTGQDVTLPEGYVWYETMLVLRPDLSEEERDMELAKFEAFLKKEEALEISALVRGSQHLAYPIDGYWDGVYVLYTYGAQRRVSQAVQKLLSTPIVGQDKKNVLRHMTFII
ncbi:probable 30S ribosomal protein S6 at C-terminar half [Coccomyxa sp. Obi]|nr:probable 30S ribosomal protein S6 at C-terminar half [Coccomyxa sp. Obi]